MSETTTQVIPFVESVEDSRLRPGIFPVVGRRPLPEYTEDRKNVRIYCVSCHHPGAFVSAEMIDVVIFLCDEFTTCGCNCVKTKGELPLPRLNI